MNPELRAALELLLGLLADPRTGVLIGLLVAAAWIDFSCGRIPNLLVLGGTLAGLGCAALIPPFHTSASDALLSSTAGMLCGFALLLPFYLLRAMGAGDVKLMAMTGTLLGFPDAVWAVLGTFLAGGALSLLFLAWKGELRRALANIGALGVATGSGSIPVLNARASAGTLPYGVAIAIGTIGYLALHQLGLIH